ncbi:MAG: cystathionine gamma-synthase [Chloroflexota bacterium]|nr:cystathionine gamma-synthase [Chloroflexota bacterium]
MTERIETRLVRAGWEPDPETGAVAPPIQMSTTFKQDAVGQTRSGFEYGRSDNPTRRALEAAIVDLEGASHGFAYASGLAATQNLLYLLAPGDRILMIDDAYGGTYRLAHRVWERYGIAVDCVDMRDLDAVARAIGDGTRMVWIESPSNPLLKIVDVAGVARIARDAGAVSVVDGTFTSPYLQQPLELGVDVVMHSATKYIGGHSDVISGLIATNRDDVAERLRFHQNAAGAVPSPFDCWLVLRGIRTLALRMERQCANAATIAGWLAERGDVAAVHYPGLPGHPQRELVQRQMRLPGAIVSFEVDGGEDEARRVAAATRVFTLAESLGAVESLIEVPAAMTHASVSDTPLAVPGGLIRLSVGIEHVDDLIADLDAALSR